MTARKLHYYVKPGPSSYPKLGFPIAESVRTTQERSYPGFHEITEEREILLLRKGDVLWNKRILAKPFVQLELDKDTIAADGLEIATLSMNDIPGALKFIQVSVGGMPQQVPREDGKLEISSHQTAAVTIKVTDPLVLSNELSLRFT